VNLGVLDHNEHEEYTKVTTLWALWVRCVLRDPEKFR